jgi:hypothetical protein
MECTPVYPRLVCFKLQASLHQGGVRARIQMNTTELVLEISQLPILPVAFQVRGFEEK